MTNLERKLRNTVCDILILAGIPEEQAEDFVEKKTFVELQAFLVLVTDHLC